jgi:lysophospholipase L1-like esterase
MYSSTKFIRRRAAASLTAAFILLIAKAPAQTPPAADARVPAANFAEKLCKVYGNVKASFTTEGTDTLLKLEFGGGDGKFGGGWFPIPAPKVDDAKCRGIALTARGNGTTPGQSFLHLKDAKGGAYRSKDLKELYPNKEWTEMVLGPGDFIIDPMGNAEVNKTLPKEPKWTEIRRMDISAVSLESEPAIEFKAIGFATGDAPAAAAPAAAKTATSDPMAKYAGVVLQNNAGNEPLTPFARGIKFPQGTWLERHEQFLARARQGDVDLLWLGDSITDNWNSNKGVYKKLFPDVKSANFGIGGDGTQHLLWRLQNGELEGIEPKIAVLLIGTNNVQWHQSAQIAAAIEKIVGTIRAKCPKTKVLLMGIFPRGDIPATSPGHARIQEVNATISKLDDGRNVRYLDIRSKLTNPDGTLLEEAFIDKVHLSPKGFTIWAEAIKPLMEEMTR